MCVLICVCLCMHICILLLCIMYVHVHRDLPMYIRHVPSPPKSWQILDGQDASLFSKSSEAGINLGLKDAGTESRAPAGVGAEVLKVLGFRIKGSCGFRSLGRSEFRAGPGCITDAPHSVAGRSAQGLGARALRRRRPRACRHPKMEVHTTEDIARAWASHLVGLAR